MPTQSVVPDFGQQLARIRGARDLSKERLARMAGISRTTLQRAESEDKCGLSVGTVQLIMKALSQSSPPLTAAEAMWFAQEAGMDRNVALQYVTDKVSNDDATAIDTITNRLVSLVGPAHVRRILEAINDSFGAISGPKKARSYIVTHPPVQRPGFVEQTEVEYTERDPGTQAPGTSAAGF